MKFPKTYRVFLGSIANGTAEHDLFEAALELDGLLNENKDIIISYEGKNGVSCAEIIILNADDDDKLKDAFYCDQPLSRWKNDLMEVKNQSQ